MAIADIRMNTCRFCGKQEFGEFGTSLVKYNVRHYAHAECGLQKLGVKFLDRLHPWQIANLPWRAVKAAGLDSEVKSRIRGAQ